MATKAEKIVAGLGGIDNIEEIEGCITRLRTEVVDPDLGNEAAPMPQPERSRRRSWPDL
ncbi:PTS transporter subunit EIIB, partial [Streptomyces hirsutus]|uniref:PTS transporter subunit EIIB n=1 Tax=Streptomyces hirsutus TaxID=35620 RepID=UPI003661F4BE